MNRVSVEAGRGAWALAPARAFRRITGFAVAVFAVGLPVLAASAADPHLAAKYRLGADDLVRIEVFREEDLMREVRVSASGTVSFPLIGEVRVAGLTLRAVERLIASKLRDRFLKNPKVTVTIVEYRPFYINGEVEKPGGYPYQPGLTVHKAISLAGGLKERASKRKIYLVHEGEDESARRRVNLDTPVGPGDIIIVEQSFF